MLTSPPGHLEKDCIERSYWKSARSLSAHCVHAVKECNVFIFADLNLQKKKKTHNLVNFPAFIYERCTQNVEHLCGLRQKKKKKAFDIFKIGPDTSSTNQLTMCSKSLFCFDFHTRDCSLKQRKESEKVSGGGNRKYHSRFPFKSFVCY